MSLPTLRESSRSRWVGASNRLGHDRRTPWSRPSALALLVLTGLACSDDPSPPECLPACGAGERCVDGVCRPEGPDAAHLDARTRDAEPEDAGLDLGEDLGLDAGVGPDAAADAGLDAGTLPVCAPPGGECTTAEDCAVGRPGPSNCPFCPREHRTVCRAARCVTAPVLRAGDFQEVAFTVNGTIVPRLQALVGVVMVAETSGGAPLTCADVARASFDVQEPCYNALTSRLITISQVGQSYTFTYGAFMSGQPVLLLVYGFDSTRPEGAPIGVSCTPHQVGGPGSGRVLLEGGRMEPFVR